MSTPPASATASGTPSRAVAPVELRLPIEGMTCASCVNRIERFLRKTPGVDEANVNLATETATIRYLPDRAGRAELVSAIQAAGYDVRQSSTPATAARVLDQATSEEDAQRAKEQRDLAVRAAVSLVVAAGIMALMFWPQTVWPMEDLNRLVLLPATIIQFWAGRRFYESAWRAVRHFDANMNTLVAIGTTAAWAYSVFVTFWPSVIHEAGLHPETYFDSSAVIVGLVLLGRWLEARARGRASGAIRHLLGLQPAIARLVRDGQDIEVELASVEPGDLLRVRPGDRLPVDGVVIEGASAVDESMLTGESMPVTRGPGDEVIGGTLNTSGTFIFRATRVGADTALAQIVDLVERAQGSKAPIQEVADRISAIFVPIVLAIGAFTFAIWLVAGPEPRVTLALAAFITVVVVACPCAMGLATPTAIMVGTGKGAEAGLLIRNGAALERAQRVTMVVLDKTGTLTIGRPAVVDVAAVPGVDPLHVIDLAASVERGSEHPLAGAILARAKEAGLGDRPVDSFSSVAGHGVEAMIDGGRVLVGNARFAADHGIDTAPLAEAAGRAADRGWTASYVGLDDRLLGLIAIADPVRPESASAVREMRDAGLDVWLVTGDQRSTAEAVARQVGIGPDRVLAEVLPSDKARQVARLQAAGGIVAMVGDGVNDAPALAQADLGIAIGTGSDVAIEASDVTLIGGDPRGVPAALALANRTVAVIRQNLFWAFAYNIILIPVAMGVLYPAFGITINPAMAAGAMALSSVSVVSNSLRLRGFDARPAGRRAVSHGALATLRDGWFLVSIALIGLTVVVGVTAMDRALDAGAQQVVQVVRGTAWTETEIHVTAGRLVVLTLRNEDPIFHDLMVDGLANVDTPARPGQTARVRFKVDAPGRYPFECTVPGHADAGMRGVLVVEPAG